MILIHAADLHLGSPLGGLDQHDQLPAHEIRQAPMRAFARLAQLCEERDADVLVIAGDLFDGDADLSTMRAASQLLERICARGTQIVTISGNHDATSKMQLHVPAITGLTQLPTDAPGTARFDDLGIAVHGRGFATREVLDNIVPSYPAPIPGLLNVGLLHTSLSGAPGHDPYAPCTIDDLVARGYQYWALGHVHKRAVLLDAPWVIYPGNIQGRDVGERGARGVTVVTYADGQVLGTPEPVELDEFRWSVLELQLEAEETAAQLVERAGSELDAIVADALQVTHLVRIVISGQGPAHDELDRSPGRWRSALQAAALEVSPTSLYLERIKLRTRPALPDRADLLAREDFIGDAARELLAQSEPATPIDDDALSGLRKKLAKLPGELGDTLASDVTQDELDAAREALVARLLVAHAEDAQVAR